MSDLTYLMGNDKKLLPYYKDIMERKGPFHIQIMPTNKCNLNCEFCGVKDKNNGQELFLDTVLNTLNNLPHLKSVEFTGGGEPTLFHDFEKWVNIIYKRNLKIGLVTNGSNLHNIKSCLSLMSWIRVSTNGWIDHNIPIHLESIPSSVKYGLNYVVHKNSNTDYINKLKDLRTKYPNIRYIRISDDVYKSNKEFDEIDKDNMIKKKIVWGKSSSLCYQGSVKCILAPNGKLFSCCIICANEGTYDPKYKMSLDDLKSYTPFKCPYDKCMFESRNIFIESCLNHSDDNMEFV